MIGMCLKRYDVTPSGAPLRRGTYIDIPTEIGFPHFIKDDNLDEGGRLYGRFKLSLQAFICHRGQSVDSGHYIAIVRGTYDAASSTTSTNSGTTPPDSSRFWMRFDDLADERVTLVDVEKALRDESPYLLFWQILPIDEDGSEANTLDRPQSYASSEGVQDILDAHLGLNGKLEHAETAPSRPSFEITLPDSLPPRSPTASSRRPSTAVSDFMEPVNGSGAPRPTPSSPMLTPRDDEGGPASSLSWSRRGSRVGGVGKSASSSRTGSQGGENRISATFARLTGRRSRDKSSADDTSTDEDEFIKERVDHLLDGTDGRLALGITEHKEEPPRACSRNGEKGKGKSREKLRDKNGRKLERECAIM